MMDKKSIAIIAGVLILYMLFMQSKMNQPNIPTISYNDKGEMMISNCDLPENELLGNCARAYCEKHLLENNIVKRNTRLNMSSYGYNFNDDLNRLEVTVKYKERGEKIYLKCVMNNLDVVEVKKLNENEI